MKLEIIRSCFTNGTNGIIYNNKQFICYCIELPWLQNKPQFSCIPLGSYRIVCRYSLRHKAHLMLMNVPARALILIHPANDALAQLRGCIAPVSVLTGQGKGTGSRVAFKKLLNLVTKSLEAGPVFITIKSKEQ